MSQNKFHWHLILLLQDEWIARKDINIGSENISLKILFSQMLLQKCSYEFRTPFVVMHFCKSHLIEEYDVRK